MEPEDLRRLVTWQMPFGRYQGTVLADLPGAYLGWFARTGFPEGDLGRLLALMHEISHNGLRDLLTPLRADPVRTDPVRTDPVRTDPPASSTGAGPPPGDPPS